MYGDTQVEVEEQALASERLSSTHSAPGVRSVAGHFDVRFQTPVLSIVSLALVVLIFFDLALGGLMIEVDRLVSRLPGPFISPYDYPVADWLDRIGQATVAGIPLLAVSVIACRRLNSIRPFVLTWGIWAVMYGFVGAVKFVTMRESPRTGGPVLFDSGTLFPSGHASNVVLMFGLTALLMIRYVGVTRWQRTLLIAAVPAAFMFMSVISIYRHTHWLSDIVVGGLIGVIALELWVRCDACWPSVRYWLRRLSGRHWKVADRTARLLRTAILEEDSVWNEGVSDSRPRRVPLRAAAPPASSRVPTRCVTATEASASPSPESPPPVGVRYPVRS